MTTQRRNFLRLIGASGLATSMASWSLPTLAASDTPATLGKSSGRRVVVVGGGFGGTIAAKFIRMQDPGIEVVLIEPNRQFVASPMSNLYLGGLLPDLSTLTMGYDQLLAKHGIKMVYDSVTAIDPEKKTVTVSAGTIDYDRLVLSPGIDFRIEEIQGYDPKTTPELMPHAWKTGAQTQLLRLQLVDMPDGGTVVLTVPVAPFRSHAAPYERASMIAMYLKQHKPKSKIVLLDANPNILVHAELFKKGWKKHYDGIIDYRSAQNLTAVDGAKRSVRLQGGKEIKGDVVNLIPPQRASQIAVTAGLVGRDKSWCPVNELTFESTLKKNIHVIGDACSVGAMPKSGFSANGQAKICAHNIVALMNDKEPSEISSIDTAFSYVSAKEAASVVSVFATKDGKTTQVPNSGGVSPDWSEAEAAYASSWFKNILTEMSS